MAWHTQYPYQPIYNGTLYHLIVNDHNSELVASTLVELSPNGYQTPTNGQGLRPQGKQFVIMKITTLSNIPNELLSGKRKNYNIQLVAC